MTRIDEKPINHGRDHLPEGPDPIPGLPSLGEDVDDIIMSYGPAAFWKLNEVSGAIAADSSGNDHDLTQAGGLVPPTWQQEDAPPGEPSALFPDTPGGGGGDGNAGFNANADVAMSGFTNNFTCGVWANYFDNVQNNELVGQGTPSHTGNGWGLMINSGKLNVLVATDSIIGDNTLTPGDWYFMACVRDAGTFKIYVNGIVQADTMTTSFTGSANTFIANDNNTPGGSHNQLTAGLLSYAFIIDDVLTGTQLLEIYEAGFSGGAIGAGKVWTSNGDGSASWQYPTIEVEY